VPTQCPIVTYASEGMLTCLPCSEGYACDVGTTTPTPIENACPKGYYCKLNGGGTAVDVIPCPAGTYGLGKFA